MEYFCNSSVRVNAPALNTVTKILEIIFNHLTKDDLKRIITEERISRKRALKIAAVYGLEFEVRTCMDLVGMTSTEALTEWDLL